MKKQIYKTTDSMDNEPEITFETDGKKLITMREGGIKIHRENFPEATTDELVGELLKILEEKITVKFEGKAEL